MLFRSPKGYDFTPFFEAIFEFKDCVFYEKYANNYDYNKTSLSNALRRVVAGDLLALERDFRITLQGDAKLWAAHLQPYTPEVAKHLDYLEMQGAGPQLLVLTVVERKGERTTTCFYP